MKSKFLVITLASLMIFTLVICGCSKSSDDVYENTKSVTQDTISQVTSETDKESEPYKTESVTTGLTSDVEDVPENADNADSEIIGSENDESVASDNNIPEETEETTQKEITEVEMDFADFE